ncbi:hypothetical protein [Undibacterium sp. Ji22W]|uniref:hypothetical protein n=1 Tax=Undibacterium sp. Ji22W TaxID=3413038 RepID=UPI003BF1AF86
MKRMKQRMLQRTIQHLASGLSMIALTTLGPIALSASAQTSLPLEVADQHPLVKVFKPCVSAVGLEHDLPLANPVPDLSGPGHLYQLNDVGRIRDGYRHSLYVSADQKQIYIVQIGGFAGTHKVFGPLNPKMHCAKPAKKTATKK